MAEPALVDSRVGAEREAVGMTIEQVAPVVCQLAVVAGDAAASGSATCAGGTENPVANAVTDERLKVLSA